MFGLFSILKTGFHLPGSPDWLRNGIGDPVMLPAAIKGAQVEMAIPAPLWICLEGAEINPYITYLFLGELLTSYIFHYVCDRTVTININGH